MLPIITTAGVDGSQLDTMWPDLAGHSLDVFGPAINRAARLASIPVHGQFLLSGETAVALTKAKSNLDFIERVRAGADALVSTLPMENGLAPIAEIIPVARVKNISSISLNSPWLVVELRERKPIAQAEAPDQPKTLLQQFKSVQSIRVIELVSNNGALVPAAADEAMQKLRSEVLAKDRPSLFFIDLVFRVTDAWISCWGGKECKAKCVCGLQRDRYYEKRRHSFKQRDCFPEKYSALSIVFTGTPDANTDAAIRDELLLKEDAWRLEPTTLRIHEHAYHNDDLASAAKGGRFYLIEFQVRRGATRPDDPRVFTGIKLHYPQVGIEVFAYGLVEGLTDGFILFRTDKNPDDVKKFFIDSQFRPGSSASDFLQNIVPLTLYSLDYVHTNPNREIWDALTALPKFSKSAI